MSDVERHPLAGICEVNITNDHIREVALGCSLYSAEGTAKGIWYTMRGSMWHLVYLCLKRYNNEGEYNGSGPSWQSLNVMKKGKSGEQECLSGRMGGQG